MERTTEYDNIYYVMIDEHENDRDYLVKMTEAQETGQYNEWD
jgi:hypothetical protein